jgi:hypothetical protein
MDHPTNPPMLAELPLGLGAAFLVVAGACTFSPSEDRPFLVGAFAVAGLLAIGVAIAMRRAEPSDTH